MSVPAAYIGVILIWSTTPLAIKWSSEAGFLFGVASRMSLGLLFCLLLLFALRAPFPRDRKAVQAYVAAGLGIFGSMTSVYWSSQFIPSGLISLLFGITPMLTGLIASIVLHEKAFTRGKLLGMLMGFVGLAVIFGHSAEIGSKLHYGIGGVLLSTLLHSAAAVWVKKINAQLHPVAQTAGALVVVVFLYLLLAIAIGGIAPTKLSERSLWSILYLAIFGSVIGFILYFYALQKMDASRMALVTLVTPVTALLLGSALNQEVIAPEVWIGAAAILVGLMAYQWGDRWMHSLRL